MTSGRPYIAARRSRFSGGTPKAVSTMPSGSNRRSLRKAASGRPETISIIRAATSMPTLYCQRDPGWKASGNLRKVVDRLFERDLRVSSFAARTSG